MRRKTTVGISNHAKARMRQRRVDTRQVEQTLRKPCKVVTGKCPDTRVYYNGNAYNNLWICIVVAGFASGAVFAMGAPIVASLVTGGGVSTTLKIVTVFRQRKTSKEK
jgi:hypothetical protein